MSRCVIVRDVWADNLSFEFGLIRRVVDDYPNVAMDTEFPGTIIFPDKHYSCLSPSDNYFLMKSNVDSLNLIQVGLTLSDNQGNLPDLYTDSCYVWQFNFRDFDIESDDLRNADSIKLLKRQGIDFKKNREEGIDSREFAKMLLWSGLVYKRPLKRWVTFHSGYDFGFLIKMLTHRELPENLETFMAMVHFYFGGNVYDIKHLIRDCNGLNGGLERVAKALGVDRAAGKSHQAGSDSLLTMQTFLKLLNLKMVDTSFINRLIQEEEEEEGVGGSDSRLRSVLYGLETNFKYTYFEYTSFDWVPEQICYVLIPSY
ncbi:hypothetical protein LOK49_LG10G00975 [Camellia lanceoleosa]|uniref:Uncharacterized protein n=1 Tax=Camellia lanceoleosa TaxID=1840588 RepID=A0ACC0GBT3_9ERIC|nr:hypothetical protein LOK49_LG10G00975 [Camellia lanceoleosa]